MKTVYYISKCVRMVTIAYFDFWNTDPRGSFYDGAILGILIYLLSMWMLHYLISS